MQKTQQAGQSPVFGLRYLEDREVEGLDIVGCFTRQEIGGGLKSTATGCDDVDGGFLTP